MINQWREYSLSSDGSYHVHRGHPAYASRFLEVLKFHAPGLAPARDASGAYHIKPDGRPAYNARYVRTFGFYEGFAAVHSDDGWFHVLPDGSPLYRERYAWCGNFQEGRSPVRLPDGGYVHITDYGSPAYGECHRYAGDFKDGFAVVQRKDGKHSHIDRSGNLLHDRWFVDLDVFHKNFARSRDERGWHHVDLGGLPLYERRFSNVEPFYNGQARAEGFDGSLSVINESGENLVELRRPLRSPLEELSADMVGVWKTQTIRAAVELGVFDSLSASAEEIEKGLPLAESAGPRLMRALTELGLTWQDGKGVYHPTAKGSYLRRTHPLSLSDAALHWGGDSAAAWSAAGRSLRTGRSGFEELRRENFFDSLQGRPEELQSYHRAMAAYARHDYASIAGAVNFGVHHHILDAAGGTGELIFALLRAFPNLTATVMDRPEVVNSAVAPTDVAKRCGFIAGDLFLEWPVASNAVVLARVLHDWPDDAALRILRRAREVMTVGGALYVIEMALEESSSGSGGLLDLNMLVMTGGTERSLEQFWTLLAQAGFELLDVRTTSAISSVIQAKAV